MSNGKDLFNFGLGQNINNNNISTGGSLFNFNSGNNDNKNSLFGENNNNNLFGLFNNKEEKNKDSPFGLFNNNEENKSNSLFGSGGGMNLFQQKEDEKDKEGGLSNIFGNMDLNKNHKESNLFNTNNSNLFGNKIFGNDSDDNNNNNDHKFNFNSNINNINININAYIENSRNNLFNFENNDIGNEEVEEDEKKEESKVEEAKEEEPKKVKVSEELEKPDELDSIDNKEYIRLINSKMKNYKKEMDSTVDKIEENKKALIAQEKLFNNFIDKINISNKVINYIKDNLDNNTRQLERISDEQDKIINDLDFIEENLDKKIGAQRSKEEFIKKNDEKNKELDNTFININNKIELCHRNLKENNIVVENNEIKTLNQLLNRVIHRIKKDVQGKQIEYLDNIYKTEKAVLDN